MNDQVLSKYADFVDEAIVEKYLCYEEKIKASAKYFALRYLKIVAVACVCVMVINMAFVAVASDGGRLVRVNFSDLFDYREIEYITITGGPLDSVHTSLREKDDIKRFCKMFSFWLNVYMTPEPIVSDQEPEDKENLVIPRGVCSVCVKHKDSEEVFVLFIDTDNSFVLYKDGKTYICDKTYILDCGKIRNFK